MLTAGNGGLGLWIFVRRTAHRHDLALSLPLISGSSVPNIRLRMEAFRTCLGKSKTIRQKADPADGPSGDALVLGDQLLGRRHELIFGSLITAKVAYPPKPSDGRRDGARAQLRL